MNHAITIGGLLLTIGCLGGLVAAGIGLLMIFAGMMSDAGDDTSGPGCITFVVGVAVLVGCVAALVL